ncbi:MAG: helix-turn-helix domain-containing protein [Gammaproteobacteria bacterium]|nr:helix-turn-helix domain-containing protein [Gammaproteobacteria bacterium]NIR30170.1 helix-turn-helix domain-containing protein [Gammaproteobacteria bacterium]NIR98096.1 helix-turn-helix domain-containing protein [Gammaproteobacteria bacterium]NIT63786.1 helix-turn-helix domain-containing protein [Gammaproteobacteria bacterium]NIV20737.1 helix-turn-helix domain-containing protein [Gammaproteobacteria bacterium]
MAGKLVSLSTLRVAPCRDCNLQAKCLPNGLSGDETAEFERIVDSRRVLKRGECLYKNGDRFRALHVIRSGLVKTYTLSPNGNEHIAGFHLPGHVMGLNAIATKVHTDAARILDTTSLCRIPYDALDRLSGRIPVLRQQLVRLLSRRIAQEQSMLRELAQLPAEQRVAAFFHRTAQSFAELGFSPKQFGFRVPNVDLAAYLGLAVETVSRALSHLRNEGILNAQRASVEVHDMERLEMYARAGECRRRRLRRDGS